MQSPSMVDHALAWAARGFFVFPLREGGKEPALKGSWKELATTDPERIKRLWGSRSFNVGCIAIGHIIVDIDDKPGKSGSTDWELLGYPDDTLTVATPSGGRHLYYRAELAEGQAALSKSIDIRAGEHGYVAAPGSIVDGKSYVIERDLPILEAPAELALHCNTRRKAAREAVGELDTDEAIERAVQYLEARRGAVEGERGDIFTVLTANQVMDIGLSAEMTFELMAEHWNHKCSPPWELEGPDSLRVKVDSAWKSRDLPPGSSSPEAEFNGVTIPEVERAPRPHVMWAGDKSLDVTQQWLMYQRFPRIGTAMLVGASGSGKTFLALDLAVAMATGRAWLGKEPDERVGSVILSAEGIGGLPARMKALAEVPVVAAPVGLLTDQKAVDEVVETLKELRAELKRRFGVRLGMIVLDTMTAAGILTNENDNSEIGRAIKTLERIAVAFGCLMLVIHHPPKTSTGARGGAALHAGFDTVFEIFREGTRTDRFVECTKGRDAPIQAWGSFRLSPVTVEPDLSGRGRDVTTQEVIHGSEVRDKAPKRVPTQRDLELFFGCFDDVRADLKLPPKTSPVPLDALEQRYKSIVRSRKGSAEKAWRDVINYSREANLIHVRLGESGSAIVELLNRGDAL